MGDGIGSRRSQEHKELLTVGTPQAAGVKLQGQQAKIGVKQKRVVSKQVCPGQSLAQTAGAVNPHKELYE
jgi:hypothetical protein